MSEQKQMEPVINSPFSQDAAQGGGGIIVIADDFTGAAELAGMSLRYGLTLPVFLYDEKDSGTLTKSPLKDGAIVCSDSRSFNIDKAKKITAAAIADIIKLQPSFLYKKIDSVLRGYVVEEIKVQLELLALEKALILPANPSLGRTISNGEYFIEGKKITTTGFVNDPEFPVRSSFVNKMINDETIAVLKHTETLPGRGIVIGEAISTDDVKQWAAKVDRSWLLAGAGDFYKAMLEKEYPSKGKQHFQLQSPHLYVCGTAFNERKQFIQSLANVAYMPEVISEEWLDTTAGMIRQQKKAVIAINNSTSPALSLRTTMAKTVKEIIEREEVQEIFIEGGSTAAAILLELNIKKLIPVNELQRGVVRMKANELFITVKPGSYPLPKEIVDLYISK